MALAAGPEKQVGKLVIRNIGLMLSGKLEAPLLDADTVVAEAGRIVAVGGAADCDTDGARVVIDAHGCALAPGLIDSHVHPGAGRLDAAAEPDRLDRELHERRRHDDDLGGRGAYAGAASRRDRG